MGYLPKWGRDSTMKGRRFFDATGLRVHRLTVIKHSHERRYVTSKNVVQYWECLCDCGNVIVTPIHSIRQGKTKSCGCLRSERIEAERKERLLKNPNRGLSKTLEWKLWSAAKDRAKAKGLAFDLEVRDIVVPTHCPVLGIPLKKGNGVMHAGSPQLDRRDNSKGYTKDNVSVISQRANAIKQDASIETLEAIVNYMKGNNNGRN